MAHPRGLQIHCLWEVSVDFCKESTYDIKYKRSAIALSSPLVKRCLWIYSIGSVFPTFFHLPYFQINLPICFCISKQKTWSMQRLTPTQSSALTHPSSIPLFRWNPQDSTVLSHTALHQQGLPSNTTGVLHTWCPKFQAQGLTRTDASTDLVAHLVCFFICTEKEWKGHAAGLTFPTVL